MQVTLLNTKSMSDISLFIEDEDFLWIELIASEIYGIYYEKAYLGKCRSSYPLALRSGNQWMR